MVGSQWMNTSAISGWPIRNPRFVGIRVRRAVVSTVGIVWADIALGSVLAQGVPDAMRARVAGAYRTVNYGAHPLDE